MRNSGLCIGGPRDGQMIECEYPQLVVHAGRLMKMERPPLDYPVTDMTIHQFTYRLVHMLNHGFWWPADDTPDPQMVMDALVAGYRPKAQVAE